MDYIILWGVICILISAVSLIGGICTMVINSITHRQSKIDELVSNAYKKGYSDGRYNYIASVKERKAIAIQKNKKLKDVMEIYHMGV